MTPGLNMSLVRAAWIIARKELQIEWRTRSLLSAMLLFTLIAIMTFYFAFTDQPALRRTALPAVLWVTVAFACTLGFGRNLAADADQGTLEGLLLAPIHRAAIFYGKLLPNWLFAIAVAIVSTLALAILFNVDIPLVWWVIIVAGSLALAATGVLIGSLAVQANGRETTYPILLLPVLLPIITAAVNAAALILDGRPFADWWTYLLLLLSADLIFLILPLFMFGFIVEE